MAKDQEGLHELRRAINDLSKKEIPAGSGIKDLIPEKILKRRAIA